MEFEIHFIEQGGFFEIITSGVMTYDGFESMTQEILAHPAWQPGLNGLFDHRGLDFKNVGAQTIKKIKDLHLDNESRIGNGKSAMLLNPGEEQAWRQMWKLDPRKIESNTVCVFENRQEALQWLIGK